MSKLKRLLGALSLVALFTFSSCVDDSVAPEVTALRQAQVDLLNAEVAFQEAENRLQTAVAAAQEIANDFATAANAIAIQERQADLDESLADLEVALAEAQADLILAELAAESAANDLERFLESEGLDDAAFWLDAWNTVLNGGTIDLPDAAMPDITVVAGGLNGKRNELIEEQADLAVLQLFLEPDGEGGDTGLPQAFVDSLLALDLMEAQMGLVASTATEAAAAAALEALGADQDAYDEAEAVIDEALIALAADSVAAIAAVEAAEDSVAAAEALLADAEAVVEYFEEELEGEDGLDFGESGLTYNDALDAVAGLETAIAAHEADAAIYTAYGDSLAGIYAIYFPEFEDASDILNDLRDALAEAEAAAETGVEDEQLAVEEAWADYIREERNIKKIFVVDGDTPSNTDSANYVAARKAWDGAATSNILTDGEFDNIDDILNDNTADVLSGGDPTNTIGDGANFAVTGDAFTSAVVDGGALQAYLTALAGGDQDAVNDAKFALTSAEEFYATVTDEFAALQDAIDDLAAGDYDTSDPYSATTLVADLAGTAIYDNYVDAITDAGTLLTDDDDGLQLDPVKAQDDLLDDLADAQDDLVDAEEDLAFAEQIVAPYLEDYLAALEITEADDIDDEIALALVTPTFNLMLAEAAQDAITDAQDDLRDLKDLLDLTFGTFVVNDDNFTELSTLEDKIEFWEGVLEGAEEGSDDLREAIAKIEVDIAKAAINQIKAEDLVAEKEQEIAELETEIAVLEALLADIQARVLAAIGG